MNYLNNAVVDELRLIMEDDVNFLFSAYLEDCSDQLLVLAESVLNKDSDKTRRIAHSLKGSSRNVGASVFSDVCEKLEKDAREENFESWDKLLDEIQVSFLATQKQIQNDILV